MNLQPIAIAQRSVDTPARRARVLNLLNELWYIQPSSRELPERELHSLASARCSFRMQNLLEMRIHLRDLRSPEALNLRGVMLEALGHHSRARRMYQLALAEDRGLFAAEINLRRSYELWEFGRSDIPYAL